MWFKAVVKWCVMVVMFLMVAGFVLNQVDVDGLLFLSDGLNSFGTYLVVLKLAVFALLAVYWKEFCVFVGDRQHDPALAGALYKKWPLVFGFIAVVELTAVL